MKKITAFFMAILPFVVVVILFATGLIVKDAKHVYVKAIECIDNSLSIQQTTDTPEEFDVSRNVNIIPAIASNPALFYTTDDPEVVKVDYTSGKAVVAGFGTTNINIKSQENPQITAKCKVTVWDDKVHKIIVDNKTKTSFVPCNTSVVLQTRTIPTIAGEKLSYEVESGSEALVSVDNDGKITTGTTPGVASINISSSNKSVTLNHKIYIGNLIESIYFDNPATTLVSDTKYDLSKHIHTAPFDVMTQNINVSEYFDFATSDYISAEIDANGLITFKNQTDSNNIPVFTVTLKGTTVSASKSIASTLEYLIDVSFNKYNYTTTLTSSNINKPINASEFNWSVYPTATATTVPVELDSTDKNVVELVDGEFVIKGAGQTTLSATIYTSETTTKTDRCFVTILDPTTKILSKDTITLSDSYNCYLGQYVNKQYLNQHIEWNVIEGTVASVNDSGVVTFKQAGTVQVQAKVGSTTSTITINCTNSKGRVIDVTDTTKTYVAKAGEKITFEANGKTIKPSFDDEQSKKVTQIDETTYILKAGSEEVWEVAFEDAESIYFVIQEDAIGVSPIKPDLWPYYVTNSSIVDVSSLVTSYPSTATNSDGEKIYPEYEITLEEGSISKVVGTLITFAKPEYADIKVKFNDQTYEYGVKSQFGLFGKFSLKDGTKVIQSGETYTLGSGISKTFEIDDLYINDLPEEPTKEEMEERFRIQSLNNGTIVKDLKTTYDAGNKKLTFSFTTNTIGSDVVLISNDTFNFIINVNVTDEIHSFNLFNSDGTELSSSSSSEAPINSYSKDLNLFISTNPSGAKSEEIIIKWNDNEITLNNSFIDLAKVEWKSGVNELKLTAKNTLATSTYYLQYKNNITNFEIQQSVVDQGKNFVYVPAATTLANMTIKISDGLASPSFFNNNFKYVVDGKEFKTESNQINIQLPDATDLNPGCEKEVTVTYTSGSTITSKYTISRDIVSKIVLPNHNNAEEDDKKGMQRVHVFGNKSYYDDVEKEIDGYRLPIEIYDYKGVKIDDVVKKEQLFNSLVTTFNKQGGSVTYEQGHLWVKFDSNSLYTPEEIFNDAFASGSKSQKINVATHWGLYNLNKPKGKDANVSYSFVAVEGVNCYVQEAIITNNSKDKNIVLQTNFGMEGLTKENQPFDKAMQWSECNAFYGNGYGINFDAGTTTEKHRLHAYYLLNVRLFGCNDEKLKQQTDKMCYFNEYAASALKIKYCIFENWYQAIMFDTQGNHQSYLQNSVFYNNKANCFSVNRGASCYVQDCGFFKCSNIALTISGQSKVYFKGAVEIYNFVNDEIFKDIQGHDLSFLWPVIEPLLKEAKMLQTGPDGREYVNAYCLSLLENHFFFYKGKDDEGKDIYEEDEQGSSLAANHLAKGINVDVPFVGNVTVWTTRNPQTETGAPSYYDEYDKDGNIRTKKLQELIIKLSRQA